MGSNKGNGRNQGPGRRRNGNNGERKSSPALEALESRTLLDGGGIIPHAVPTWVPTSTDLHDVKNGPMANAGPDLISIYFEYQAFLQNGHGNFTSAKAPYIYF